MEETTSTVIMSVSVIRWQSKAIEYSKCTTISGNRRGLHVSGVPLIPHSFMLHSSPLVALVLQHLEQAIKGSEYRFPMGLGWPADLHTCIERRI